MPLAVVTEEDVQRVELKTVAGGFVVLKRMTYGQIIERRALTVMTMEGDRKDKDKVRGEMAMANREVARFEFRVCIVEHNLEGVDGQNLNLGGAGFDNLHPKIGQEIEKHINEMNNYAETDEDSQGN